MQEFRRPMIYLYVSKISSTSSVRPSPDTKLFLPNISSMTVVLMVFYVRFHALVFRYFGHLSKVEII